MLKAAPEPNRRAEQTSAARPPSPGKGDAAVDALKMPPEPAPGWATFEYVTCWVTGIAAFFWCLDALDGELYLIALAAGWFAGNVAGVLVQPAAYRWRRRRYFHHRCSHRVRGGATQKACPTCAAALGRVRRAEEAETRARQRKRDLSNQAKQVMESERVRLLENGLQELDGLLKLSPYAFEDRIADLYRRMGYEVEQTPYSNDRGRDAILKRNGAVYLLECKRHDRSRSIGRRDLQIFYAAVMEAKAERGFFVTTARCNANAREFVSDKPIEIVDSESLLKLIRKHYTREGHSDTYRVLCEECGAAVVHSLTAPPAVLNCSRGHPVRASLTADTVFGSLQRATREVSCPRCSSPMKGVKGRHGYFWSCTRYPACRGTRRHRRGRR